MANYRPKSLNELNNLYDKSIASQNVIKSNASALNTSSRQTVADIRSATDEFFAEEEKNISESTCADLTQDINEFIRNFGNPVKEDPAPVYHRPVPVPVKPAPAAPKAVKSSALREEPPKQESVSESPAQTEPQRSEKTEFVMTAERSELFDEYMRIMSDEDDDAEYSKTRSRRKKRGKKSEELSFDSFDTTAVPDPVKTEAIEESPAEEPEIPVADSDDFSSFLEADSQEAEEISDEAAYTEPEESDESELAEAMYEDGEDDYGEDEQEETSEPKKKNVFLQILFILILLVTLVSALLVTALQVIIKVDSGEAFADKYYAYTVDKKDTVTGLDEGDLILAEKTDIFTGDVFAYYNAGSQDFDFAVKTFAEGSEITTGENEADKTVRILNTAIRGKATKIYPKVGSLAALVSENFMVVIAGQIALAVILILILAFAFSRGSKAGKKSKKDNLSFDEEEDLEETFEEDFGFSNKRKR